MMKKLITLTLSIVATLLLGASAVLAQGGDRTTFTGTVISYGSGFNTRTTTNTFTLNLTGVSRPFRRQRSG